MILEKIIEITNRRVRDVYGNTTYKQIPIAEVTRIFVFWIALKQKPIKSLFSSAQHNITDKNTITKSIDKTLLMLRLVPVNAFLGLWDFIKWAFQKTTRKTIINEADILICVNHRKHKLFTNDIVKQLEDSGKSVVFFHWPLARENKYDLPLMTSMPKFWTKSYMRARLCCSFIDYVHATLHVVKPKKVIVVEGDSYEHHIFGLFKQAFNYQCICIQWGYEPRSALRMGYRNMPYDKLLVWGDFFRNTFQKHNKNIDITSVGHPKLEIKTKREAKGDALLFALQRPMAPYVTKEDINDLILLAIQTANRFPKKHIIVRNHPNYGIPKQHIHALNNTSNIVIHRYNEYSINQSLEKAKFCISISSTLGFEAIYHGVIPLFIKCNQIPLLLQKDMSRFNNGMHIIDRSALIDFLESKKSTELTIPDSTLFFKHNKDAATKEIAQQILS